jgi:hypothetical protein
MTPGEYIRAIVCGWPKEVRERRLLVMLQGYADDSGSDGTRAPYILAGFILPAGKWESFSDDWDATLRRPPAIKYFKMSEANAREGQFAGVREEFVQCKIKDLLAVIARHDPDGVYSQLDWNEYREILEPVTPKPLKNPYYMLFPAIFDAVLFYQKRKKIFPETIDLDFDEQGSLGDFARMGYPYMKAQADQDVQAMLGRTPTMLDDEKVMPLQAADMLAWNLRREFDLDDPGKRWHWLYTELNKFIWLGVKFGPPSFEAALQMLKESYAGSGLALPESW